ncbi:prephenate dehydratase [Chelatococcus sambhunathii]|uniref:prephenate dehydratase n=1 Tax=Chelatococcus sambhunathii TaxID=363953 RepID=A0ABU1DIX9_9HYPH|nr:prephenate dehydratase [Chelatococcus sambhunathii]MDR4308049.1 prephenate dehydratase [Chelatococcus sambhunathii]
MSVNGKIAYQGEPGANSHLACANVYPGMEPAPYPSFEDALAAIASGECALGMIPIENSANGRVADIHHLMPSAGLHIVGEYFMPIHHQLMAVKGATLDTVKTVQSHVQALGQCRGRIRALGLRPLIGADTAGSAHEIAEAGDPSRAAIASELAAEVYGLEILARNVEDFDNNTTRFVVLSREKAWAPAGRGLTVTTFVFKVRNIPAALYKALGGFATNAINMTKLESYQLDGAFTATQFYADVEGHPKDPALRRALDELKYFSTEIAVLGVYPAHDFRVAARALEAEAAARLGKAGRR